MSSSNAKLPVTPSLVEEVSLLIHQRTGIQLGAKQVAMVESRLKRRYYELGLNGLEEYRSHFKAHRESEIEALVSLLTTHHTFFFREFVQFEFLEEQLPRLIENVRARGSKTLEVYSAACSRGQEVYSLAMHLKKHLRELAPDISFRIFGSDVDPQSVEIGKNGVYRREEIKSVPISYLSNHWARGTGEIAEFVKAKKSLREHCDFATVNLIDPKGLDARKFDVIFCRNVFIYFTPAQIKDITRTLLKNLYEDGLFFVGVSESLHSLGLPIEAVGASVYAPKVAVKPERMKVPVAAVVPIRARANQVPNPLRVVCVDDSASILTLLKRILGKEHGFEVVGVAGNGQEAEEVIRREKPHVITLDIHMPVRTGIEFLEHTKGSSRPPVVMVTSVSRDDAALAWKALSLGAADYVEKPALNNLEQRADEIRAKLRSAYRVREKPAAKALDKEFAKISVIKDPASCAGLLVFGLGELSACAKVIKELGGTKVPLFLAIEGADAILSSVAERLVAESGQPAGAFTLGALPAMAAAAKGRALTSVMVFGEISRHGGDQLLAFSGAQLLLEDLGEGKATAPLAEVATDILPSSSFAYLASQFFSGIAVKRKPNG